MSQLGPTDRGRTSDRDTLAGQDKVITVKKITELLMSKGLLSRLKMILLAVSGQIDDSIVSTIELFVKKILD